jgi:hypothetical protein
MSGPQNSLAEKSVCRAAHEARRIAVNIAKLSELLSRHKTGVR